MILDIFGFVVPFLMLGVYGLILAVFVFSFKSKSETSPQLIPKLSIVLAIKNEAENLQDFFERISSCDLSGIELELILVNDHSNDGSLELISTSAVQFPFDFRLINAPEQITGKKGCVKLGIESAQHPWILTLDIDTNLPITFFEKLCNSVSENTLYALVPLKAKRHNSLIRSFFDLEFLSLHFVGLASAKMRKPLLSNAACSIVQKEAFIQTIEQRTDWDMPSGDDVFAMFAIADKYGSKAVGVANFSETLVEVDFPHRFSILWQQRIRWLGKSSQITDRWFILISLLVLIFNLLLAYSILKYIVWGFSTSNIVFLFTSLAIQFSFLTYVCNVLDRRDLIKWSVPLSIIYPFYLISIFIAQFIWKPKWK